MKIPLYGQRDSRWASQSINGTASTIGKYGCTISCIAMISGRTPGEQESYMRSIGAFGDKEKGQGDLVLWTKTPGFKWRFYCVDTPAPLEDIKAEIRAGRPVLVHVDLSANDKKPDHWVLVVDEDFTIHDPWFDETVPFSKRYGNPSTGIYGGAYFNPQTNLDDMSQADKDRLAFYDQYYPQLLQAKTNEFQRTGEDTVYMILAAPSLPFFVDFMKASFDNVRKIPADWPIDPIFWSGQREVLRTDLVQAQTLAGNLTTENEALKNVNKDLNTENKRLKDQLLNPPVVIPPVVIPPVEVPVPTPVPPQSSPNIEQLILNLVEWLKKVLSQK